jgi:hypothetical protein
MDGIAAGGGPIDVGCVNRWLRLKVRRWPRLNVVTVMLVVTMHRFPSDGVACKADSESDRSDKAFDHGLSSPWRKDARWRVCSTPRIGEFRLA